MWWKLKSHWFLKGWWLRSVKLTIRAKSEKQVSFCSVFVLFAFFFFKCKTSTLMKQETAKKRRNRSKLFGSVEVLLLDQSFCRCKCSEEDKTQTLVNIFFCLDICCEKKWKNWEKKKRNWTCYPHRPPSPSADSNEPLLALSFDKIGIKSVLNKKDLLFLTYDSSLFAFCYYSQFNNNALVHQPPALYNFLSAVLR